jgi:HEAT repeat protein
MEPITLKSWLEELQSPDAEARAKAARGGATMGASAIAPLADLMASTDKGAARAAKQALQHLAHHAARPGATPEARRASTELLKVAASGRPRAVRADALELLGFVGGREVVLALATLLRDAEVREEARMTLERIPGPESLRALQEAMKSAPEDFKPALRQSLHARSLDARTVGVSVLRPS